MNSFFSLVLAGRILSVGFELFGLRFFTKSFMIAVGFGDDYRVAPLNLNRFIPLKYEMRLPCYRGVL
jgi:hypothetical protein